MNEWKNLREDKIPEDILTGKYEFEYDSDFWTKSTENVLEILRKIQLPSFYYRYRKLEPKIPTHEDIMTKWWRGETTLRGIHQPIWFKVRFYFPERTKQYGAIAIGPDNESAIIVFNNKSWFEDKESKDIPPEKE